MVEPPRREVPPPTGFGSDADSLQSIYSLIPKQPKRDEEKLMTMQVCVLDSSSTLLAHKGNLRRSYLHVPIDVHAYAGKGAEDFGQVRGPHGPRRHGPQICYHILSLGENESKSMSIEIEVRTLILLGVLRTN